MRGSACKERDGRIAAVPRALVASIGLVACLGAVAYGAAARGGNHDPGQHKPASPQLPRPSIGQRPDKLATSTSARFGFSVDRRGLRFQCRLDRRGWRVCQTPAAFTKLDPGDHAFSVRALDRKGRHGPAARFRWKLLEPKDFSIVPQLSGLSALYPGAPPVPLPLTIANPNPVPIRVTSLRVAATADAEGCTSAVNLELIESSVSSAAPLKVPAGGSISLPAPGVSAPAIQLRDLPLDQDACQRASFPLAFSGDARG